MGSMIALQTNEYTEYFSNLWNILKPNDWIYDDNGLKKNKIVIKAIILLTFALCIVSRHIDMHVAYEYKNLHVCFH